MLQHIWEEKKESGEITINGYTTGCGCCQGSIYGKEDIIEELKYNMRFLIRSCDMLDIDLVRFKEMVEKELMEEQK